MSDPNADLIAEFVVESREGLAAIEEDLLAIEAGGESPDPDLVGKVFRAIHSIKGASGFLGLSVIGDLSHSLENVLSLLRTGGLSMDASRTEVMLAAADELRCLLEDIDGSNGRDVSVHVAALDRIAAGEPTTPAAPQHPPEPSGTSAPHAPHASSRNGASICGLVGGSAERLATALSDGRNVFAVRFDALEDPEARRDAVEFVQRLKDAGEVLGGTLDFAAAGDPATGPTGPVEWTVAFATILDRDTLAGFWQMPAERIVPWSEFSSDDPAAATPTDRSGDEESRRIDESRNIAAPRAVAEFAEASESFAAPAPAPAAPTSADGAKPAAEPPLGGESSRAAASSRGDGSVRVSTALLGRLMNLAGELVLGRNRLLQACGTDATEGTGELAAVAHRIDQITSELQEAIMRTRLQPVGTVFGKFSRVVRDLGAKLGKQCRLSVTGQEVELDRTIVEALGDPLTHLVRNALDHGIESPEVRRAAGKDPTGTITLEACHKEGKVHLAVRDDGAGIDPAKLRRKAVEKGLLTPQQAEQTSDRDAVRLVFHPGFSTAEQVSDVSGRGVGMDVVLTNFERLGGTVDIETEPGRGTTILVRLPLTLAIVPALIVRAGRTSFAVPQGAIGELVRIRPDERERRIERVKGAELLRLRGSLLPLVRLADFFGEGSDGRDQRGDAARSTNVVVVAAGATRFGLVVDGLRETEEIVVKPLGRHLKGIRWLAGATILGDGGIALIVDVAGLAARAGIVQTEPSVRNAGDEAERLADESIDALLVTNHPDEQFAVPMHLVARVETVASDRIETIADRLVLQYRGATLPLVALESVLPARPRPASDRTYVVVCRAGGTEIGLLAPHIKDTRRLPAELDTATLPAAGVLGSTIVEGCTTRVLDVFQIARLAFPDRFGRSSVAVPTVSVAGAPHGSAGGEARTASGTEAAQSATAPCVLLAEDSHFFRAKLAQFLRDEGWDVVECEDGQAAWDALCEPDWSCSLVLTDIEMPRLDGFGLCTRIRSRPEFASLPVIAVTSLADDASLERSRRAGVTRHLVKLDREQLIGAVSEFLRPARRRPGSPRPVAGTN